VISWGGTRGDWGGHLPPSLYVKKGPERESALRSKNTQTTIAEFAGVNSKYWPGVLRTTFLDGVCFNNLPIGIVLAYSRPNC
jgi:hypothetical protein